MRHSMVQHVVRSYITFATFPSTPHLNPNARFWTEGLTAYRPVLRGVTAVTCAGGYGYSDLISNAPDLNWGGLVI